MAAAEPIPVPVPAAAGGTNNKIKTVVVLVQENRSFDHMLGWMKSLNPDINGVTGAETNHVDASDPASRAVRFSDGAEYVDPDPGHSMQAIYEQVYGTVRDYSWAIVGLGP